MERPETLLVVCTGFVIFFGLLFGTLLLMRWFRHRERLAMIEQGMMPADAAKPHNGQATLAWGIGISAFGLALLCGFSPRIFKAISDPYISIASITSAVLPGAIILFMGLALIAIYFVTRSTPDKEPAEELPPSTALDELPDLPALDLEEDEGASH